MRAINDLISEYKSAKTDEAKHKIFGKILRAKKECFSDWTAFYKFVDEECSRDDATPEIRVLMAKRFAEQIIEKKLHINMSFDEMLTVMREHEKKLSQ